MKKIAVTGGLSSGKTTVCKFFKHLGAYVVSADEIVHRILSSNTSIIKQLTDLFGTSILSGVEIDRKKLAALVFPQPDKLRMLETILHPEVMQEIEKNYEIAKRENVRLFVAEIPVLYEVGLENKFDAVIAIKTPDLLAKERYRGSSEEFERRRKQQQKDYKAHYTIHNSGTLEALENQVKNLYQILIQGA